MALDIKYGVSTWLWTSPFDTAAIDVLFPKIRDMGFDVVEIAVEDPSLIHIPSLKRALNTYGLKALVCGAFGPGRDLTSEDDALQNNSLQYIEACLEICAELETGFFGGPMYSAVGKARMLPTELRKKEWNLAVNNLRKVCAMADRHGLKIALEPLNRFESDLVNTVDDALRMIGDIDHPAAQIMLDSFHMGIEERNAEQAIIKAGDNLMHIQVAENYRGAPGSGQTNWDAYRRGLEKINYTGAVCIESFTTENRELAGAVCFWHPMAESQDIFATEGLAFLKNWGGAAEKKSLKPMLNKSL